MASTENTKDLKWCAHCRKWLKKSEFHRNSSKPDGLSTYCKEGMKKHVKDSKRKNPFPRRA